MIRDYNSSNNQNIKCKFVEREVLANVNRMVDYIIQQDDYNDAPFNYDDIVNLYYDNTEEIEELNKIIDDDTTTIEVSHQLMDQIADLEGMEEEPREWYESYIVTSFLADKLIDKGQLVIPHMNIWLRQTSGQAVLLDGVISEICEELEILEGQRNYKYWKNL